MHALEPYLGLVHFVIWIVWVGYWNLTAFGTKSTVRRESPVQRFSHYGPIVLAAVILSMPPLPPPLGDRIFDLGWAPYFVGTALLLAGLIFAIWSRRVLGRNWSSDVTVKQDHELIRTGPYRWVRHPIYTGLLLGFTGSALAQNRWSGLLVSALVFGALWFKLRREEKWMSETFGTKYLEYTVHTARLIPFVL